MSLFGTAGIRGPVEDRVTPDLALAVGRAAGRDAVERDGPGPADPDDRPEFVLARDGRETGDALLAALRSGIESAGARVVVAGRLPTPALAYASRGRRGVMVTASHNPPPDNGIKLFADGVEYDRAAERRIEQRVDADGPATWDRWTTGLRAAPIGEYREDLAAYLRRAVRGGVPDHRSDDGASEDGAGTGRSAGDGVDAADSDGPTAVDADAPWEPLAGLRVAVDCGNGVGALATPQVLTSLGASVEAVNANVDGRFPGRSSKPTAENLADFRRFVGDAAADRAFDLAIAHDGDADRTVVLDGDGEVVHEDTVLAIVAEHYVRTHDRSDPVVVTTPNASARVDQRVAAAGGRVRRVRLGALHEGIAEVRADGDAVAFAGEPWKHVHPDWGGWIDGVASAGLVAGLVARAGGLASLREPVTELPYRKTSVDCPDDRKPAAMDRVEARLPDRLAEWADAALGDGTGDRGGIDPNAGDDPGESSGEVVVDTDHGVRVDLPDGSWVLVRPSGTEPLIRLYAESDAVPDLMATARAVVADAVDDA